MIDSLKEEICVMVAQFRRIALKLQRISASHAIRLSTLNERERTARRLELPAVVDVALQVTEVHTR